jgi:transcriptional regulator with XRE-family HTH domain
MSETLTKRAQREILAAIETAGLTREEIALRMGKSPSTVSQSLRDDDVKLSTLERIAAAAGVTIHVFASSHRDL